MPGQLPGWRQVFADDFDGNALDRSIWGAYDGQPSGAPNAWWDPSHVVVHDGMLDLQTYQDSRFGNKWVSGGVSSAPAASLTYGKYLARFRMDDGFGVAGILLLMGRDSWPPEVDFAENGGDNNRQHMSAVLHYSPQNLQVHRTVYADFTQWHTIGVEWTPGKLVYTLDGEAWATVEGDHVPADPMDFDIQAQAGNCAPGWDLCPGAATPAQVNLQVDWVAVYAPG
jgi:beta-glucanase (GH16 family)